MRYKNNRSKKSLIWNRGKGWIDYWWRGAAQSFGNPPPPSYRVSRALSTFRNTRSTAFYLRIRASETRAKIVGWNSYQKRVFHEIAFLFKLLSAKGEEGEEKFTGEKKHPVIACAVSKYENTLVNCGRKNKIGSRFEARSSYRNV